MILQSVLIIPIFYLINASSEELGNEQCFFYYLFFRSGYFIGKLF